MAAEAFGDFPFYFPGEGASVTFDYEVVIQGSAEPAGDADVSQARVFRNNNKAESSLVTTLELQKNGAGTCSVDLSGLDVTDSPLLVSFLFEKEVDGETRRSEVDRVVALAAPAVGEVDANRYVFSRDETVDVSVSRWAGLVHDEAGRPPRLDAGTDAEPVDPARFPAGAVDGVAWRKVIDDGSAAVEAAAFQDHDGAGRQTTFTVAAEHVGKRVTFEGRLGEQPVEARPQVAMNGPTVAIQEKPRAFAYVTPAGSPLDPIELHATSTPPGGSLSWTVADGTKVRVIGRGATCSVSGLAPGQTTVTVTCTYLDKTTTDTIDVIAWRLSIEHPSGDPAAAGGATNEFVYSAASPGVLSIECRAAVEPDDEHVRGECDRVARWAITAVGDSALTWSAPDPEDATKGAGRVATASFRGLPARHDHFGEKTVSLSVAGSAAAPLTTKIEVFWPKNATNHPGGAETGHASRPPNWFYYWRQVIGEGHLQHARYGGAGDGSAHARVEAMTHFSYGATLSNGNPFDKQRLVMFDSCSTTFPAVGTFGPWTGIDFFFNTFKHENNHVDQIRRADPVVGLHAGTCWANGWSWNVASNHFSLGAGRTANTGGVCTPAGPGTMGTAAGDTQLDTGYGHWPDAWGAVPPPPAGGYPQNHPIEYESYQRMTGAEHGLMRYDWGAPGKNHRTRRKWDD